MEHLQISYHPRRVMLTPSPSLVVYEMVDPDPDLPVAEATEDPHFQTIETPTFVPPPAPRDLLAIPEEVIESLTEWLGH